MDVVTIADNAFLSAVNITSVTIANGVKSIGTFSFFVCINLTSITIPSSVTSIGDQAFAQCTSLTMYTLLASKPDDWDTNWNPSNCEVKWGESAPNN